LHFGIAQFRYRVANIAGDHQHRFRPKLRPIRNNIHHRGNYYGENRVGPRLLSPKGMAIDDILKGILSRPVEGLSDVKRMERNGETTETIDPNDVSFHDVVLALEQVCKEKYRDPGRRLHFIGLLLTVFSAETVSAYWQKVEKMEEGEATSANRGPAWMVSCLYSKDVVALVLSHPLEVVAA
jgi:hypothetical protein